MIDKDDLRGRARKLSSIHINLIENLGMLMDTPQGNMTLIRGYYIRHLDASRFTRQKISAIGASTSEGADDVIRYLESNLPPDVNTHIDMSNYMSTLTEDEIREKAKIARDDLLKFKDFRVYIPDPESPSKPVAPSATHTNSVDSVSAPKLDSRPPENPAIGVQSPVRRSIKWALPIAIGGGILLLVELRRRRINKVAKWDQAPTN